MYAQYIESFPRAKALGVARALRLSVGEKPADFNSVCRSANENAPTREGLRRKLCGGRHGRRERDKPITARGRRGCAAWCLNVCCVARGPLPRSLQEWRVAPWRRASPIPRRPLVASSSLHSRPCSWAGLGLGSKDSPIRPTRYERPPFPAHSSLLASESSTSVFKGAARVARRRRRVTGRMAAEFHPLHRP